MYPIIATINNFNVYSFGLFLSISFVVSTFIIYIYSKDEFKEEQYLDAYLYTSLISVIFARIYYIIQNFDQFGFNLLRYILVREAPGLSLLSGFTTGFIFLYFYARFKKWNYLRVADIFSVAFSLMLSLSKIGEQISGSSFGKETSHFLGIRIIGLSGKRWPVEGIEMLCFFLIFITLVILFNIRKKIHYEEGLSFFAFVFGSVLIIFFTEFLKIYKAIFIGMSTRQIIAIVIMFAFVYPLYAKIKVTRNLKKGKN